MLSGHRSVRRPRCRNTRTARIAAPVSALIALGLDVGSGEGSPRGEGKTDDLPSVQVRVRLRHGYLPALRHAVAGGPVSGDGNTRRSQVARWPLGTRRSQDACWPLGIRRSQDA
jgi:hypothetical protein